MPALERDGAVGARGDVLDDGVAVAVLVGERHQDVERDRRQRQQLVGGFVVIVVWPWRR